MTTRLVGLVVLTLTPVFLLVLWSASGERARARASTEREILMEAGAVALEFNSIIEEARRFLVATALVPQIRDRSEGACELLEKIAEADQRYLSVALLNEKGRYICQTVNADATNTSVADRDWFRVPMFEGRPASQLILRGRVSNAALLVSGEPVRDDTGKVVAVVAAGLDLRGLITAHGPFTAARDRLELIGSGVVIESRKQGPSPKEFSPITDGQRMLLDRGEREALAVVDGASGREAVAVVRIPAAPSIVISLAESEADILEGVDAVFRRSLLLLALLTVVSLTAAWFAASRFVTEPLTSVIDAADALGGGDLAARAGIDHGPGEVRRLGEAFDSMAEALQERDAAIKQATEALKDRDERLAQAQKMEAIGQLTGGVAHDFNNLLTVIQGNLELVSEDHLAPAQAPLVDYALDAARRGADLTNRLLLFSRRQALAPREINLNELCQGMRHLLERTLGERVTVRYECAEDLPMCAADPSQLESVLVNLAINARDAMPDGGSITISTSATDEPPDGLDPGPYVVLSIADDGTGMSDEVMARALEPFFTTKERGRGTGLGLSGAYGFAEQSGGKLTIESAVGRGSTIRVFLPTRAYT
jgi:signal transduction histidine kinase